MQYKKLGNTDIEVPVICLGTMTWGQQNTEEQAHEQLNYAVDDRNITFIDTAEIYPVPPTGELQGTTERFIGTWLKDRTDREDLFIASKVAVAPGLVTTRESGAEGKFDKKSITEAINGTLERLQTDYVDLYQIHWPERQANFFGARAYAHNEEDASTPILETLQALDELVKAGKVKQIGVSNETPWGVNEYLRLAREENLPRIVSIQNQYSLTNRTFEIGLSEIAIKEQVGLLAYSALNMGVLTGKYLDGARPVGARFTDTMRNSARYNPEHAEPVVRKYVELAKKYDMTPAELALAFVAAQRFTTSVIIGATTMDQLKVCIDAGELELTSELLADIQALYTEHPDPTV
ncbi:MAG: aryl-alcohol dehydrogenase-like predicted oxidoreductase [Candidatus Paceibacteria bacterium]|jgi:aryl-alcohol dehydrogenase-like predicted oxidoreductase